MAVVERVMSVPPERVFAVLGDADAYGDWVVGSDKIRDADAHWPARGARFHHRVGFGPLKVNDHSEVLDVDPPRRLVLKTNVRPVLTAVVTLTLEPHGDGGTLVRMREEAGDRASRLWLNPLSAPLLRRRNALALRRLEELAAGERR